MNLPSNELKSLMEDFILIIIKSDEGFNSGKKTCVG